MSGQQVDAKANISLYYSENDNIFIVQEVEVSFLPYRSHVSDIHKAPIFSRPSRAAAATNSLGSSNFLHCYHNHIAIGPPHVGHHKGHQMATVRDSSEKKMHGEREIGNKLLAAINKRHTEDRNWIDGR